MRNVLPFLAYCRMCAGVMFKKGSFPFIFNNYKEIFTYADVPSLDGIRSNKKLNACIFAFCTYVRIYRHRTGSTNWEGD